MTTLSTFNEVDNNRPLLPRLIDINSNFTYDSKPLLLFDIDAINNELYNLIFTTPGERPFEPEYGLNLWQKVFDPIDDITAWEMDTILLEGINRWMGHIKLVRNGDSASGVFPKPEWPGFLVRIVYSIKGVNNPTNQTVDFSLLRSSTP